MISASQTRNHGENASTENIVEVRDLVKVYEGNVRAVDGVTFDVRRSEIFGFLGPNGAGKTTTIRILVALLRRTSGTVSVDGFDPQVQPDEVRARIGYAAQSAALDGDLTGFENLDLVGRLQGLSRRESAARARELLELLHLDDAAGRRARTYSGGMRRRLDLAGALVHRPRLLILDEPTSGLDPQTRLGLWTYLEELKSQGTTILLTTQYLEEADRLAGRVAIIDHGCLAVMGTPAELKAGIGADVVTISVPEYSADQIPAVESRLADLPGLVEIRHDGSSVSVYIRDGAAAVAGIVRRLDTAGIQVGGLTLSTPTLDDAFLKHTGARMRSEEVKETRSPLSRRRR